MGKSIPSSSAINSHDSIRIITSDDLRRPLHIKPPTRTPAGPPNSRLRGIRAELVEPNLNLNAIQKMEASSSWAKKKRGVPLSEVVADCVDRWFDEALTQAEAGDSDMQLLVGQMYCNGYGVKTNCIKGRRWLSKASQTRSEVWNCGYKHPGYNAADSETNDEDCACQTEF